MKDQVDIEAYLRSRFDVHHLGRGALLHHNCPLCSESRMRGWVNLERWTAGCWNEGCQANHHLPGGVLELVRQVEGLRTKGAAKLFLLQEFPATGPTNVIVVPTWQDAGHTDWCRLPTQMRPLKLECKDYLVPFTARWFIRFAAQQWGVGLEDLEWAQAGYCLTGKYAWRIVFPIVMYGQVVAFQARTVRGAEPKYLGSKRGFQSNPAAECGRPTEACLYNYDALYSGCVAVMVEGVGDVLRARRHAPADVVPFALLGTALTQEKLALLMMKKPGQVVVALDDEPEARQRAMRYVEGLFAHMGTSVQFGQWVGGKDAGSGATLKRWDMNRVEDILELRMGMIGE